ncbi:MAG: hypothetical protein ACPG4U_05095 [Pseudomonadales bacterium]
MQRTEFLTSPQIDECADNWCFDARVESYRVRFSVPITPRNRGMAISQCIEYEWQEQALIFLERTQIRADSYVDLSTSRVLKLA